MSYNNSRIEDQDNYKSRLDKYKEYEDLNEDEFNHEYNQILTYWENFIKENSPGLLEDRDYFVHQKNLFEVIRRVDKRRIYYKVFHSLTRINEFKYIALICYWINTLKPFMVVNSDSKIYNSPNELFSVYLIISMVRSAFNEVFPEEKFIYPSDKRIADMTYNFKYCDLSREATITFVETFADNYGVGIQYILNKISDDNNHPNTKSD